MRDDLRDNAFFSGVDPAARARILAAFRFAAFAPGAPLYARGDAASRVFLIVRGRVAIEQPTAGVSTAIAMLGPGEFIGARAILGDGARHMWSAIADEETLVAYADGDDVLAALDDLAAIGLNVARALHRRLADAASAIDVLITAS